MTDRLSPFKPTPVPEQDPDYVWPDEIALSTVRSLADLHTLFPHLKRRHDRDAAAVSRWETAEEKRQQAARSAAMRRLGRRLLREP